ncbi:MULTISPECIES: HEAT repeat domain-containing protein [Halobacterium]|uniref:HEAT repeat-containing taxis protein OE_2401F n=5 Tax=Halobacterium salinarum TaxID=2242 RepID=HTAXP_HALS3|nr:MULTISPECIES: HEAT repeat domain-containing protein [Halobacterium]B0R4J2.1 RecName: Full=HEAT repeat-containing taxis protein OE_2401F [Halobacterium salinarum R1]MBB6090500.1 HEAT repeat protein [Halobacterium salinarum]MCF2165587.1 HEAT repeat domain-containing protein [Halobacterium salinarum]MCF2168355.1 HEAT repeat domain-containing protein [Halobacterium salinarum]MCF2206880.1 HEAT repeat domain-containing protein [Halobacterium salinarum]MCF2239505.1 HEAT repeat domain-containing p
MPSLYGLERSGDVEKLVELLQESEKETVRRRAAEILGNLDEPEPEGIQALVDAMSDDDESVRAAAIDALTQQEAVDALMRGLDQEVPDSGATWAQAEAFVENLESETPELRMAAANVLGLLGVEDTARPLAKQLQTEEHVGVRARVARALGRIEQPAVTGILVDCLHGEPLKVRREAAESLGRLTTEQALDGLLSVVEDDSEAMRRTAVSSLGRFETAEPVDALVERLGDESDLVRRAAVFSLIEILSNVPPDQSHELRETIVDRMSARSDPSIIKSLIEIIDEGTQLHQRRNATWMLGRVAGDQRTKMDAIEALRELLGEDDDLIAQFAATGLAEIGGASVETSLLEVVETQEYGEDAVAMAAFALGKVGGDRSRQRLERLVDETDSEEVRRRAFSAISKLGGKT